MFLRTRRTLCTGLLGLAWLSRASTAAAAEGQWSLGGSVGPAWLQRAGWGAEGALRLGYGLGDYVELDVQGTLASFPVEENSRSLGAVALGADYRLDVIEWIPYVGLGAGWAAIGDTISTEQGFAASLNYGVDRLLSRSWSVGGVVEHQLFLGGSRKLWSHALRAVVSFRFEP